MYDNYSQNICSDGDDGSDGGGDGSRMEWCGANERRCYSIYE